MGIKSRVMVVQERQGKTREQAIAQLEQVRLDEAAVPAAPMAEQATGEGEGQGGGAKDVTGLDFGGGGEGTSTLAAVGQAEIPGNTDSLRQQVG